MANSFLSGKRYAPLIYMYIVYVYPMNSNDTPIVFMAKLPLLVVHDAEKRNYSRPEICTLRLQNAKALKQPWGI